MNMSSQRSTKNQSGVVSLTVAIVMMLVITLIVLTFAKIIRREQRQALDRQLSTQAFYAAESGINSATEAMKQGFTGDKTGCGPVSSGNSTIEGLLNDIKLDTAGTVSVTCLTINQNPGDLKYDTVGDRSSVVVPLENVGDNAFKSVTLSWKPANGSPTALSSCSTPGSFPQSGTASWNCPVGLLRVDIVPTQGPLTRASLNSSVFTAFMYPGTGTGTVVYNAANSGAIVTASCSNVTKTCTTTITGLSATQYRMRVRSIYSTSSLNVTATISGDVAAQLKNGQAVVDVTAKANDVLKRIQARIPLSGVDDVPDFALRTTDTICKRFLYIPESSVTPDSSDPACDIPN